MHCTFENFMVTTRKKGPFLFDDLTWRYGNARTSVVTFLLLYLKFKLFIKPFPTKTRFTSKWLILKMSTRVLAFCKINGMFKTIRFCRFLINTTIIYKFFFSLTRHTALCKLSQCFLEIVGDLDHRWSFFVTTKLKCYFEKPSVFYATDTFIELLVPTLTDKIFH